MFFTRVDQRSEIFSDYNNGQIGESNDFKEDLEFVTDTIDEALMRIATHFGIPLSKTKKYLVYVAENEFEHLFQLCFMQRADTGEHFDYFDNKLCKEWKEHKFVVKDVTVDFAIFKFNPVSISKEEIDALGATRLTDEHDN